MIDTLFDVLLLDGSLLHKLGISLASDEVGTRDHAERILLHIFLHAHLEGDVAIVHGVIEQLACQITQMDGLGVG